MDSLRVNTGIKVIEVNDKGETISVNLTDNDFFVRYDNFLRWLGAKEKDAQELDEKMAKRESSSTDLFDEYFGDYKKICDDVCGELDNLFGENCCQKVFYGVKSPGLEVIADFVEKITPLLQSYANERKQNIQLKYNRNRKGARSK